MPVGKWMEIIGMDSKAPGGRREGIIPPPVTRPASQRTAQLREQSARDLLSREDSSPSPPPEKEKQERKVVKKEEKEQGGWEPWLEIQRGNFNPVKVWALLLPTDHQVSAYFLRPHGFPQSKDISTSISCVTGSQQYMLS